MIEITIKVFAATIVGSLIGLERTLSKKHAGIRTHAILCLSTCALICLSDLIASDQISRIIAGAIQGVGFIGAGVIFMHKNDDVKGLTSSVILWLTAIIGMIIGSNYYLIALPILAAYTLGAIVFNIIERKIRSKI